MGIAQREIMILHRGWQPYLVIMAMIALGSTSCSKSPPPPPPPPTVTEVVISAALGLNPAPPDDRPSPVVITLYELAGTEAFLSADFYQLSGGPDAILGKDLVARDQLTVKPGSRQNWVREVAPKTRFIGIVAAYRLIDQAGWRAVAPVPLNRTTELMARLNPLAVTLVPTDD
jgi:type VI secretion system protein VasD